MLTVTYEKLVALMLTSSFGTPNVGLSTHTL